MIDTNRVKAVIFDLGRVLIQVDFTAGLFKYYQRSDDSSDEQILEELFKDPVFIAFNTGKITGQQVYEKIVEKYNLELSYDQFRFEWSNIFAPMPGMESLAYRVCSKLPCGLLSDIDPLHWAFCLKNFPVVRNFRNPSLSFDIGALKPDPRCYQHAAHNVQTDISNCLFIDDRQVNVEGARAAGMQAVQFFDSEQLEKDLHFLGI
jgi:putative hydrolase of the HAD superfamily